MKTFTIGLLAAVAFGLSAVSLLAQPSGVMNVVTLTATASVERESIDNDTNTITPLPIVKTVTTKAILKQLALDKFAQGEYNSTNFPIGAKLVVFTGDNNTVFEVVDKNNNFLADVSDILSLNLAETGVFSGKVNDDTDLANSTTTSRRMVGFVFDDTAITDGGNIRFYLSGLAKSVTIDTKPDSTGLYTETQTHTISSAAGDGSYHGSDMVISGSFGANGKATLHLF